MKEQYEWLRTWCDEAAQTSLPRVLLVGDSITEGYYGYVREALTGLCYVDCIATSYSADTRVYRDMLLAFFADSDYRAVHFNHGLHGKYMTATAYEAALRELLPFVKGKLVLATTTAVYEQGNESINLSWQEKIQERNAAVQRLARALGARVNDLYTLSLKIPKENRGADGTHYTEEGYGLLGAQVARYLKDVL